MRQDKAFLLDEVRDKLEKHSSFVLAEYEKITANDMGGFRNLIASLGGDVHMVKKRIFLKAAGVEGMEFNQKQLTGHLAIVFAGADSIEAAKAVVKFGKDSGGSVKVLGGRIDSQVYNAKEVQTLSELPGINEMRAQLLSVFEAPAQQTVSVMQSLVAAVVYCLQNKCDMEAKK